MPEALRCIAGIVAEVFDEVRLVKKAVLVADICQGFCTVQIAQYRIEADY